MSWVIFEIFFGLFVWVEALRHIQQFFSHVGMEPHLPVYYQYFLGGKCILLKDTTRRSVLGSKPRPLAPESDALPLGQRASLLFFLFLETVTVTV